MTIPSGPQPPLGTITSGQLYVDAQTKLQWFGVPTTFDPSGSILVGDIAGLMQADSGVLTSANAYTDTIAAGKANTVHQHVIADVTGLQAALDGAAAGIPHGSIILWSGSLGTIPGGWTVCNGQNGTPDLRDKFIMGAGGVRTALTTGGLASYSGSVDVGGAHTPTGTVVAHVLSYNEMPVHTHGVGDPGHAHGVYDPGHAHSMYDQAGPAGNSGNTRFTCEFLAVNSSGPKGTDVAGTGIGIYAAGTGIYLGNAGANWGHDHPLTMNAVAGHVHTLTVPTLPPFIVLGYIMKV
jgi:hypothetical protein